MNRVLAAREINRRYDGEWVYVADPVVDAAGKLLRGRVLVHGKDSDAVYKKASVLKTQPAHFAFLRIGTPRHDFATIL